MRLQKKILNMIIQAKGGDIDFADGLAKELERGMEEIYEDVRKEAREDAFKEVASMFGIKYKKGFGFILSEKFLRALKDK